MGSQQIISNERALQAFESPFQANHLVPDAQLLEHGIDEGGFLTKTAAFAPFGKFLCCLCITSAKRDQHEQSLNTTTSPIYQVNNHSSSNIPCHSNLPQHQPGSILSTSELLKTYSFPPHSTKLVSLLEQILKQPAGDKCIIFTEWKKTLDAVSFMLQDHRIRHCRIDAAVRSTERQRTLTTFNTDPQQNILLMTIGTGAVGLNLTIANRVHILEPQWNPMTEKQAIGRVVRLGQRKEVFIHRYIMRGTIEEQVLSSQRSKLALAMNAFQRHKEDNQAVQTIKDTIREVQTFQ